MFLKTLSIALLVALVSGRSSRQSRQFQQEPASTDQATYEFHYEILSPGNGDIKSQTEVRDGVTVNGEYVVAQPDGCVRTVRYVAGPGGFVPQVTYEGTCDPARYQAPQPTNGAYFIKYEAPVPQPQIQPPQYYQSQPSLTVPLQSENYFSYESVQAPETDTETVIAPAEEEIVEHPDATVEYAAPDYAPKFAPEPVPESSPQFTPEAYEAHLKEEVVPAAGAPEVNEEDVIAPAAYEDQVVEPALTAEAAEEESLYEAPTPVATSHSAEQYYNVPEQRQGYSVPARPAKYSKSFKGIIANPVSTPINTLAPESTHEATAAVSAYETEQTYAENENADQELSFADSAVSVPDAVPTYARPAILSAKSVNTHVARPQAAYHAPVLASTGATPSVELVYQTPSSIPRPVKPAYIKPARPDARPIVHKPAKAPATKPLATVHPKPAKAPAQKPKPSYTPAMTPAAHQRPVYVSRPRQTAASKVTYSASIQAAVPLQDSWEAPLLQRPVAASPARPRHYAVPTFATY